MATAFVCVICQREAQDSQWALHKNRHLAPVCWSCEEVSHYSWTGAARQRRVVAGAHMDRRKVRQIGALADALFGAANQAQWEARHGVA